MASKLIEKHRKQYLDLLGVQPFYRRKQVELSAASFLNFDEDVIADAIELAPAVSEFQSESVSNIDVPVAQVIAEVVAKTSVQEKTESQIQIDTPEISSVYSLTDRPEFQMWCMLFEGVLFIDSVPLHLSVQDQTINKRLLINIARALEIKNLKPVVFDQLKWPQFPNPKLRQSSFDASEYLAQKLAILKSQHSVSQIVVLGAEASWFYSALENSDEIKKIQDIPAVSTYCLSEMVRLPQLKAEVWATLKGLKSIKL